MAGNRKTRDPHDLDFRDDDGSPQIQFVDDTGQSAATGAERPDDGVNPAASGGSEPAQVAAPARSDASAPNDTNGTSGADTFLVHTGTLAAAVAQPPAIPQFSGYSAAQGDVIDFTAIRSVAFVADKPDSSQLRVVEDTSGQSATFQFNFGTAQNPAWTELAKLDGVQLGDTVKVAVDATHILELHSAWLA